MAEFHHVSKLKAVTYCGRAADIQEYCMKASPTGPRVVVRRWRDTGEFEIDAIIGDGRNTSFRRLERVIYRPYAGHDGDLRNVAMHVRVLADRHFGGRQ